MAKCLIVYFSQSGTTHKVALEIAEGLKSGGYQVDLCNMRDQIPPSVEGYDLLGIGSPSYYFQPPFCVSEYVQRLPALNGKPAFVFVTYGSFFVITGNVIRQGLIKAGAKEIGYFKCKGADLMASYLRRGYLVSPNNPTTEEFTQARDFGEKTIPQNLKGNYNPTPFESSPSLIFTIETIFVTRWFTKNIYSRTFTVNRDKCTSCKTCWDEGKTQICVNTCPTRNIAKKDDKKLVFGRACLLCFNCIMKCPVDAVYCWSDLLFDPLIRYNIYKATHNPSLEYSHVEHKNGVTKVIDKK